jgi:pSer/pThr/pTyr-binding forkhead associated (FHA) protein
MSDGTDIVSTQFEAADVPRRAAELGIPIHTVILDNQSLSAPDKEEGRQYLTQIATGTGALSTTLATIDDLRPIWDQIAAFREQMTIQYTADDVAGGDYSVEVSLRNNPAVQDVTTVTFPAGAPSIVIELPPESRSLTLANLDQPVPLSFSTTLSWLDGVDRNIEKAQLLVNGLLVQDIDPGDVDRFDVELANLRFGANQVQIAIVDDQGGRATSPEITLTIEQGEVTEIPEEIAPRGLAGRIWQRISGFAIVIGGCFLIVFLLVLIIGIAVAGRHNPLIRRLGLPNLLRRVPFLRTYFQDVYSVQRKVSSAKRTQKQAHRYSSDVGGRRSASKKGGKPSAFLEVLESTSAGPSRIDLDEVEVRLGRSSNQADIVFKNDGTVSRLHATIAQEGSEYRLYDEQSTSGTWVNEQRVPEYGLQLVDGDEIRLGAVRLRFRQP